MYPVLANLAALKQSVDELRRLRIGRRRVPEIQDGNRHDPGERTLTQDAHENSRRMHPAASPAWL
jgi:hypothetical protein